MITSISISNHFTLHYDYDYITISFKNSKIEERKQQPQQLIDKLIEPNLVTVYDDYAVNSM